MPKLAGITARREGEKLESLMGVTFGMQNGREEN